MIHCYFSVSSAYYFLLEFIVSVLFVKAITVIKFFSALKQTKVEDYHFSNKVRGVLQRLGLTEFSSQFSSRISLSKVWEQVWHRAVPDSSKYQGTSVPKRSALYPQIHQSSWTVLLCSQSLWQMQQACKRCPTFFFSKVSGVSSVSNLRNCTCSLPAAWALWSVPVTGCSCLALPVTASVLELSAFCFPRTYLLGSGSFFMLEIFKQAFIKLGTYFWWVINGNYNIWEIW